EGEAVEHRTLPAGVAEGDLAELDDAGRGGGLHRVLGVGDRGPGAYDLRDAAGARLRPRYEDDHRDGHHHGHQDLHDVHQEGGEVADGHAAAVDEVSPEPEDRDAG